MKTNLKKILCLLLAAALLLPAAAILPSQAAFAEENTGSPILSDGVVAVAPNAPATFTASLGEGLDASRLACIVADTNIATVTPIAFAGNVAAFQVDFQSGGTTAAAIVHQDNPAMVSYLTIAASPIIMSVPSKLGTNRSNYCQLVSYEFVPYDFTYADLNDYRYTMNLKYQCAAYNDDDFNRWGCYGYFYDAAGTVIKKVHLYCSVLSKGRIYHSEFNVPVDAVRFSIEGL